jgi:TolB-like protein
MATATPAPANNATPDFRASIAVLPFASLAAGQEEEYFAEGLTEEIIGQLAQIEGLKVISRISVSALKATTLSLPRIADTLGVRHILQGSVRRSSDQIRVSVQLIDARNDRHVWANSYDRQLTDVFRVQEEIAKIVSETLLNMVTELRPRGLASTTRDPSAYDAYFEGTHWRQRRTREGLRRAVAAFSTAIERDSTFAPAYAGLASALSNTVGYAYEGVNRFEALARARLAAQRAINLDPTLPDGYAAYGLALAWSIMPDSAIKVADRAIALRPGSAEAHSWRGVALSQGGRHAEGFEASERGTNLDPLAPGLHAGLASQALVHGEQYQLVLESAQRSKTLEPQLTRHLEVTGLALLLTGRYEECLRIDLRSYFPLRASCLRSLGRIAEATQVADSAARVFLSKSPAISHTDVGEHLAAYYAWSGDVANTVLWLERTFEITPAVDRRITDSAVYARVRSDVRFQRSLQRARERARERVESEVRRLSENGSWRVIAGRAGL